jgi:hypothetical protein
MKPAIFIRASAMVIIALLALTGLSLQLYLVVQNAMANNISLATELLRYFSYFTILTNLLVAVCVTSLLLRPVSRPGRFFSKPAVQAAITLYIGVVGIVYIVALRHVWNPTGLQSVADRMLHYMVPVLFVMYWAFFVPKESLQWQHPLWWLLYPAIYLVYVLIRGALVDVYPYHFIDKTQLSWPEMMLSIGVLLAVFAGLGFLMVGINRLFKPNAAL